MEKGEKGQIDLDPQLRVDKFAISSKTTACQIGCKVS